MNGQELIVQKEDGILTLTLNRPERSNALTIPMRDLFEETIIGAATDDDVKVIVITGTGQAFCTGQEATRLGKRVNTGAAPEKPTRDWLLRRIAYWLTPLFTMPKPTIAAVNGIAAGGGLSVALGCDIRIASQNARFTSVFVRRGLTAAAGSTLLLPQIVGVAKALELMYTGDIIDAAEAERIGLVNRVVPPEDLMKATMELATKIANGPSVAIELIKRSVLLGLKHDWTTQQYFETYAQHIALQTEDFKEGMTAFLEKRKPTFRGR